MGDLDSFNKLQKLEDVLRETWETGDTGDTWDTGETGDTGLTTSTVKHYLTEIKPNMCEISNSKSFKSWALSQ